MEGGVAEQLFVVAVIGDTTPGTWTSQTQYLLTDHLGSVDVVTDVAGAVVERMSFDAPLFAPGDSRSGSRPPAHTKISSIAQMRVGIRSADGPEDGRSQQRVYFPRQNLVAWEYASGRPSNEP